MSSQSYPTSAACPKWLAAARLGVLVPPGDDQALAEAIGELISDPDRRRKLGEAGFARAKREYTCDLYYERLMGTYAKAIDAPRGHPA